MTIGRFSHRKEIDLGFDPKYQKLKGEIEISLFLLTNKELIKN
jgi:hypothetical protein